MTTKRMIPILFSSLGTLIIGCSTTPTRKETILMKVSDTEAHIAMKRDEFKIGDHVELYHKECKSDAPNLESRSYNAGQVCKKIDMGQGEIINVWDNDYAAVKFHEGVKFSKGDTVEKSNQ